MMKLGPRAKEFYLKESPILGSTSDLLENQRTSLSEMEPCKINYGYGRFFIIIIIIASVGGAIALLDLGLHSEHGRDFLDARSYQFGY
jgi:hypothetical protein